MKKCFNTIFEGLMNSLFKIIIMLYIYINWVYVKLNRPLVHCIYNDLMEYEVD